MKAEKTTCRRFSFCLNKFSSKCGVRERSVLAVFPIEKFRMKIQFKTIINYFTKNSYVEDRLVFEIPDL